MSLLFLPLLSLTFSVQPILIQRAIDNLSKLSFYLYLLLFAVISNFILQILQFNLMNKVAQSVVADIRSKLFAVFESLPLAYFDQTPVGRSVSRMTSDLEQLSESFSGGLLLVLMDCVNIIFIFAFMIYLNLRLTLIVTVFLIPIIFASKYYQEVFQKANLQARLELSKLNSFLHQSVVGIQIVQIHNAIAWAESKFQNINQQYFQANDESIKSDAQISAIIELLSLLSVVVLVWIASSGLKIWLSAGILIAFVQYCQFLFEPIRNLADRFSIIQSAFTALKRVDQVLAEKPENLAGQAITINPRQAIISFKNVYFRYKPDEDWVLENFSFDLYQGQKLGILGRTGAGKSTIIKLLIALYQIEKGSIEIFGQNINELSKTELREKISIIHQDSYIFAGNLLDNIYLSREVDLDNSEILNFVKLDPSLILSERAANISSGQQQVINFLRVYLGKPLVVVMDEATSKIDSATEKYLESKSEKFFQDKTVIVIAHRTESLKNCDLILQI